MQKNTNAGGIIVLSTIGIAILDAIAKFGLIKWLPEQGGHFGISWVWIEIFQNRGASLSIPIPMFLVIVASIVIMLWLLRYSREVSQVRPFEAAFGFTVCIGAAGNLTDRLINGSTTDYIQFATGAAINLSDVLILFGLAGLLYTHHRIDKTPKM